MRNMIGSVCVREGEREREERERREREMWDVMGPLVRVFAERFVVSG